MKRDTTHDVSDGLAALKKRSPMDAVKLTAKGNALIAEGPKPREIDDMFLAKMERLGWTFDGKVWTHDLDGGKRAPAKPEKTRQVTKAPAKRGG